MDSMVGRDCATEKVGVIGFSYNRGVMMRPGVITREVDTKLKVPI